MDTLATRNWVQWQSPKKAAPKIGLRPLKVTQVITLVIILLYACGKVD